MHKILIDGKIYEVDVDEVTGDKIRQIGNIGKDREVFVRRFAVGDHLAMGEDDVIVTLSQNDEFISFPFQV